MAIYASQLCHNAENEKIIGHIATQIYVLQNMIVIGWFFYRLEYIFRRTALALSKPVVTSFGVIYTLFCLFAIISGILWMLDILKWLLVIVGGFTILFTIWLAFMFTYKLFKTFQGNQDQKLLMLMRKTAFLAFISTSFILFTSIHGAVNANAESIHIDLVHAMIIMLDVYSSFLCILLSLEYFNGYYMKIFGCCESKCFTICKRYVVSEHVKDIKEDVECSKAESQNKDNAELTIVQGDKNDDHNLLQF